MSALLPLSYARHTAAALGAGAGAGGTCLSRWDNFNFKSFVRSMYVCIDKAVHVPIYPSRFYKYAVKRRCTPVVAYVHYSRVPPAG